jgi:hypothetical protein
MGRKGIARTGGIAAAAALAVGAVIATGGSAQQPTAPTSLHFTSKMQKTVGFGPRGKPVQGDRFGFGDRVSGDDTGYDRGVCTLVGKSQALCTVTLRLSKGTISAQDIITNIEGRSNKAPFAITGGTGAYDGARGTALVTDTSSTSSAIDITLRP